MHEDGNEIKKGECDEVKNYIARGLSFCIFQEHGVPGDLLYPHASFCWLPTDLLCPYNKFLRCERVTMEMCRVCNLKKCIVLGLNGVAVARHGPILGQSGATGSRKVSRYLPDLRDTIFDQKTRKLIKHLENTVIVLTRLLR